MRVLEKLIKYTCAAFLMVALLFSAAYSQFGIFSNETFNKRSYALNDYEGQTSLVDSNNYPFSCNTEDQFEKLQNLVNKKKEITGLRECEPLIEGTKAKLLKCSLWLENICQFEIEIYSESKTIWSHIINFEPATAFNFLEIEQENLSQIKNFSCDPGLDITQIINKEGSIFQLPKKVLDNKYDERFILSLDLGRSYLSYGDYVHLHEGMFKGSASTFKNILATDLKNQKVIDIENTFELFGDVSNGNWTKFIYGFKKPGGFEFRINTARNLTNHKNGVVVVKRYISLNCEMII